MHLQNSSVAERRFIGKESAACLPSSSDSDPKPKIKHHRPLQVPETQSQSHVAVEIADSSSPFDLRRGGSNHRASLASILSFLSSSLPSARTSQKLLRQVLRVRLICFHLRFLLLLSVPPLYVFFLLISVRFFLLFVFSIVTFSFVLSISLKLALPHLPSIRLFIARLLSLKLTPTRSPSSSSSRVVWSIGSKPEKKTSSGCWVQKYSSGDVYEGEFRKGKCWGSGVYYYSMKGKYEGDWVEGKYDGFGVETWAKGSRYRGEYRQGMRHGSGVYRFYTGDVYAGEWSNGQSHGCGVYTSEDGSRFVGEFKWGVKHGLGHYHFRNGDTYAGEYFADRMHGFGVYQFGNGHRYEGAWHEGRRQGLGMYTFRNGETQAGHWDDGVLSCPTEQSTRPDSSFSISHSKVLDTVQQARKAAEKAHEVVKVEERVNRAVMVANRAANSARVAATKAVQSQTYYSSGGDDPL